MIKQIKPPFIILAVFLALFASLKSVQATVWTTVPVDSNIPTQYLFELPVNITGTLSVSQTSTFSAITSSQICLGGTCNTSWPVGGGGGSVSTDTIITAGYFPKWDTVGGALSGTSTIFQVGTSTFIFGLLNASGTITQNGVPVLTTSTYNASMTIATAAPLGGGGQLSNNGQLNLTCTGCLTAAPATTTISAQGSIFTGPSFTFATSGPLLSIAGNAQTITFTTLATSTILQGYVSSTVTSALRLANANGADTAYTASNCTAGSVVTGVSATGTVLCQTTSTILTGYNPLSFNDVATSTSAGVFNITTTTTKFTLIVPPAGDQYFAPSTTIPVAANPTASIGSGATNGSAATFMRSDAAPAFATTSAWTMTGTWTYASGTLWNGTPAQTNSSALINIGPQAFFAGNASGTFLGINVTSTYNGDLVNFESSSTSRFKVASSGIVTISNISSGLVLSTAGVLSAYSASNCTAGSVVTGLSATGTVLCVTTSSVLAGYSTSTGANPTASAGTAATNGTANTFMRSDAAPAVSQSAAYSFSALGNTTSTANISALTFTENGNLVSTSTAPSLAGTYLGSSGATLTVSSTLASSTATFIFQNATTTTPYSFSDVLTNTAKTISYIDCFEYAAATTTMEVYYNTTNASTGIQQVILSSINCGIAGTSASSFTTSTLPVNAYLFVIVSSTLGTPTQTTINISAFNT